MKNYYVQDCQPNDRLTSYFLVQSKEVRFKKNSGEPYLSLTLSDRTGQIEAKMWDGVEEIVETFDRDNFIKVKANIQLYREKPQMILQKLRRAEESEIDLADYVPHTRRDIEEMFTELRDAVNGFQNPHLQALVRAFLDDEEIASRMRIAPAAKSLHHAVVGGLLEHVCSLMNLARLVASNYDYLDVDLLQTGVVLHDLGKIDELTYDRSFGYSSEGQLLGHITMCIQMIERKCGQLPDFPPRLKSLVEHMVLSHHGRYEYGSPKLPSFPEALALSYIDDLDSKLESMRAAMDAEFGTDAAWTRYNPSLERTVLNPARYLNPVVQSENGAEARQTEEPDEAWTPPPAAPPLPGVSPSSASPTKSQHPSGGSAEERSLFGEKLQMALGHRGEPQAP